MGEVQEGEVIHAIGRRFADLLGLLVQLRFGVRSRIDRCDSGKPIRPPRLSHGHASANEQESNHDQ